MGGVFSSAPSNNAEPEGALSAQVAALRVSSDAVDEVAALRAAVAASELHAASLRAALGQSERLLAKAKLHGMVLGQGSTATAIKEVVLDERPCANVFADVGEADPAALLAVSQRCAAVRPLFDALTEDSPEDDRYKPGTVHHALNGLLDAFMASLPFECRKRGWYERALGKVHIPDFAFTHACDGSLTPFTALLVVEAKRQAATNKVMHEGVIQALMRAGLRVEATLALPLDERVDVSRAWGLGVATDGSFLQVVRAEIDFGALAQTRLFMTPLLELWPAPGGSNLANSGLAALTRLLLAPPEALCGTVTILPSSVSLADGSALALGDLLGRGGFSIVFAAETYAGTGSSDMRNVAKVLRDPLCCAPAEVEVTALSLFTLPWVLAFPALHMYRDL